MIYRFSKLIYKFSKKLGRFVANINQFLYGCLISPTAELGNIKISHPVGMVIGSKVVIKDGCLLNHNVLVGICANTCKPNRGIMPTIIEENCSINTNVVITDGVCIGKNSKIGAFNFINKDVTPNTIIEPFQTLKRRIK